MPLTTRTKLGTYEILGPLGAGGMGEVYRARDAKLNRDVAIKILPAALASDPAARARFEREAQAVAALSHPNILGIFDFGIDQQTPFAVMELLDGGTLREQLHDGAIGARKAIEYAQQIAAGLGAAHAHGITHRDLKPENVFVTRDGRIKILDFGLAKIGPGADAAGPSMMATSPALTGAGTIVGTVGYMSPEQVRGRDVDHRSDIFSFAAILYELLSGQRAFTGDSAVETMNAILKEDPPELTRTNAALPPALDRIVGRCLEKNPDERFHSARDVAFALDAISTTRSEGSAAAAGSATVARRRFDLWHVASAAALAVATGAVGLVIGSGRAAQPAAAPIVTRATIALPAEALFPPQSGQFTTANVAISPDGTRIVYVGAAGNGVQLYVRSLDRLEVSPIVGTADAQNPFFSPDGDWVAFFAGGKLKKVPIVGGGAVTICDAEFVFGGAWSEDGTIVFGGHLQGGLVRVAAAGGQPEAFTSLDKGEGSHRWPALVAGTRDVLFATAAGSNWDDAHIAVQSRDSTQHRVLPDLGTSPRYLPTGHLIFARAGSLFAAPFDLARQATTGPATLLLKDVSSTFLSGNAQFAVTNAGTLVYVPGGQEDVRRSLVWVDRKGVAQPLPGAPRGYETPRISPDGERVAVTIREGDADVWIVEPRRGALTRITSELGEDHSAAWTPDGRRVSYSSTRASRSLVMTKRADGSGTEEQLIATDVHMHLGGWTPDARVLLTSGTTKSSIDLYAINIAGKPSGQSYLRTPFNESDPRPSSDGRWIAYRSDESGRDEIYV